MGSTLASYGRCKDCSESYGENSSRVDPDPTRKEAAASNSFGLVPIGTLLNVHYHPLYGICPTICLALVPQYASKHLSGFPKERGEYEEGVTVTDRHGTILSRVSDAAYVGVSIRVVAFPLVE